MPILTLIKISQPGWEKSFSSWAGVISKLQEWVCDDCLASYHYRYHQVLAKEIAAGKEREEARLAAEDEASMSLPDNFHSLSDEDKANCLLATRCGAEFIIDYQQDGINFR